MAEFREAIQKFDDRYNEAYYVWNDFYPCAEVDLRFYLGDQWTDQEKSFLYQQGRNAFVFNRIRRTIQLLTGYQRKNRLSSVVIPVEDGDQRTADQLSQLLLYVMNSGDGYQIISDCFGGALKTGWNLLCLWKDYREDLINGDIKFSREPYNGFITDPYFTRLDFSDCNYILRRKYLSKEMVTSLLPNMKKEINEIHSFGWELDDKFTWLPYQREPNGENLMAYNEMYEQKWKSVPMLVDMETGESILWEGNKDRLAMFRELYPQLEIIQKPQRYVELTIIVNDVHLKTEINPYDLDEYPFVPMVAYFEPETDLWSLKIQSLTRCMIDPQREANKRRSQMVDILDSQINSGWIAKENSVVNPHSLFQASQGKVIWKREDAQPDALEKIPPAQVPPSMFQLQELFDKDMVEIAGINDAAFGQTEMANDSGVMMLLRQGAALTNLQELFDNLRYSQKLISKKILKMMQSWKPEKVQRIINEQPTEQFYELDLTKYDVTIQEGVLTDTQRQMYFRQLVDLRQLGVPVSGEMLAQAAPLQGKTKFIEQMKQAEKQQAEAAQRQQAIEQQLLDSQSKMAQAKAISDIALGKERFTRAVANLGLEDERASQAVQDRADAALSRVKAMKELSMMDDERLLRLLQIVRLMEENNRMKEDQIKREDVTEVAVTGPPVSQMQQTSNPQPMEVPNGTGI